MQKEKRKRLTALILAAGIVTSGCSELLWDDEYVSINPHLDMGINSESLPDVQEVKNYTGLKNAILNLIRSASEKGVVRLINFSGEEEESISKACTEVMRETSMGEYAVDYIVHNTKRILSYYEAEFEIIYKRTPEQILSLQTKTSSEEYFSLLDNCLLNREEYLAVKVLGTDFEPNLLENYIRDFYLKHLFDMLELPKIKMEVFEENSAQRIVELSFSYEYHQEEQEELLGELKLLATYFLLNVPETGEKEQAEKIFDNFSEMNFAAMPQIFRTDTAYSTLKKKFADSKGFAVSYKMMCDVMKIECSVVCGAYNGKEHWWNIVKIGNAYFHVDVAGSFTHGKDKTFLRSDANLGAGYEWDKTVYPECRGA